MNLPTNPCPIGGLVPWEGGIYPIKSHRPHPVLLWLYTVHTRAPGHGLVVYHNICQEELVAEMEQHMRFAIGTTVRLAPQVQRRILGRKWHFQLGTVLYKIQGTSPGKELYLDQPDLLRRLEAAELGH